VDWHYLFRKVFTHPVIVTLCLAEFCTGFVRQGVMLYFTEYYKEVHAIPIQGGLYWWGGFAVTVGGVVGGLICGYLSDRVFQSRRPPAAFIFYIGQIVFLLLLGFLPGQRLLLASNPAAASWGGHTPGQFGAVVLLGLTCMWIFGVHGMLSGTASMDFGGKKAAATAAGMLDGIQYVASGFTGFGLGWVLDRWNWDGVRTSAETAARMPVDAHVWVLSIIPFSIIGALLMIRLWHATPLKGAGAPVTGPRRAGMPLTAAPAPSDRP
jgi:OPA family glycerol-3-phosphate transporter-like MFS transporter